MLNKFRFSSDWISMFFTQKKKNNSGRRMSKKFFAVLADFRTNFIGSSSIFFVLQALNARVSSIITFFMQLKERKQIQIMHRGKWEFQPRFNTSCMCWFYRVLSSDFHPKLVFAINILMACVIAEWVLKLLEKLILKSLDWKVECGEIFFTINIIISYHAFSIISWKCSTHMCRRRQY